jgi:hypothetical protein
LGRVFPCVSNQFGLVPSDAQQAYEDDRRPTAVFAFMSEDLATSIVPHLYFDKKGSILNITPNKNLVGYFFIYSHEKA